MKPTVSYVEERFNEFNRLCFGGALRPLPVRLSHARSFLGAVQYVKKRLPSGRWHYSDFVFKISDLIDRPQEVVDDTILHEMIHYQILSNQLRDTSPHGRIFRARMEEINRRFNRHITISHRSDEQDHANDTQLRRHLVCRLRLADGRTGVLVAARTRIFFLWDMLASSPTVEQAEWYASTDAWFNRFPRSTILRFYTPSEEELALHLRDARPLLREGARIFIGRR